MAATTIKKKRTKKAKFYRVPTNLSNLLTLLDQEARVKLHTTDKVQIKVGKQEKRYIRIDPLWLYTSRTRPDLIVEKLRIWVSDTELTLLEEEIVEIKKKFHDIMGRLMAIPGLQMQDWFDFAEKIRTEEITFEEAEALLLEIKERQDGSKPMLTLEQLGEAAKFLEYEDPVEKLMREQAEHE